MYLVNKIISILLIISFLFSHWPLNEECPKCPQCVECVEKECEPCVEKECPTCDECDTCDGQCLSDEVIQTLYVSIQELEHADTTNQKIIENLNSQIYMYIQTMENDSLMIEDYKKQIELKEEMIELVKPKWYENKWLWFGLGVAFTSGSVTLAGQLK